MFTDTELTNISTGTFVLDFIEATLTQQRNYSPDSYSGAASIFQDENKALKLKLLGRLQTAKSMAGQLMGSMNLKPGKIVGKESYFRFTGIDMSGRTWTAEDVSIETISNVVHGGQVVQASRVRELTSADKPNAVKSAVHCLFIPGKYKIPFTDFQKSPGETRPSKCQIPIGEGRRVTIEEKKGNLIVTISSEKSETDDFKNIVLEAIGIASGSHLFPQVEICRTSERSEVFVRSPKLKHIAALNLSPPIPVAEDSGFSSFRSFIQCYLRTYTTPFQQTAGLWFRILNGFHSSLENQGLILATACEGVINVEFQEESRPDKEFLDQLKEAKPLVQALAIQKRAMARLVQSIGSGKNPTMTTALYALERSGKIPEGLRKNWQGLRHKLAHAGEQEWGESETQNFVTSLYSCLELFYRLVMLRIGYEGDVRVFSKEGWPIERYFQFSPQAEEPPL